VQFLPPYFYLPFANFEAKVEYKTKSKASKIKFINVRDACESLEKNLFSN